MKQRGQVRFHRAKDRLPNFTHRYFDISEHSITDLIDGQIRTISSDIGIKELGPHIATIDEGAIFVSDLAVKPIDLAVDRLFLHYPVGSTVGDFVGLS